MKANLEICLLIIPFGSLPCRLVPVGKSARISFVFHDRPEALVTDSSLIRIEPDDRLVVLARTIQAQTSHAEAILTDAIFGAAEFGDMYLGRALYRHRSIFQGSSNAPVWSHLELTYFRNIVPIHAIRELVPTQQPESARLLRAEILLTTPSSFVVPRGWQGLEGRSDNQASLEYLDVRPAHLAVYRDIMRRYVGPAAAKLVESGRFGTFRAFETATVLIQNAALATEWTRSTCARSMSPASKDLAWSSTRRSARSHRMGASRASLPA